jgi:hypothetical protein
MLMSRLPPPPCTESIATAREAANSLRSNLSLSRLLYHSASLRLVA